MTDEITRRDFLRRAVVGGAAAIGIGELVAVRADMADAASSPTIAVASKRRPAELVRASVEALGGIGKFVKKGNRVVIKPNIGWARKAEQAATTNPEIVAEIVRLCKQAGARDIRVVDHAVDRPDALVLRMSGIEAAARKAGAQVSLASSPALYEKVSLPKGRALKSVSVIRDLRRADVFINVPIAKVHNTTGLTLGIKIRILLTNGPKGPGRTADKGIVVAGTDQVAVDAYAATLFDRKAEQIGHLQRAHAAGLGEIDLRRVNVRHV
jgi:uncharacterized protein (DUF362 family)